MTNPGARVGVLFVCYANMCRSPLAEGVFRHLAAQRGLLDRLEIDSAGTHAVEGSSPHPLSCQIAGEHGIVLTGVGRQLIRADLSRFDHIVVMDRRNLSTITRLAGSLDWCRARVRTLRSISNPKASGDELDVRDPIGEGPERYREVYDQLVAGCDALLRELFG
jgi:protein-tyrosine phosphatase